MNERIDFGIVGGYGATGQAVVSELCKSGNGRILIGGRDLARGKALAAEYDGQVSAAFLDVLDTQSLDDFCRQCSVIVNCAGPVMALQDRVAQAALRQHCHYIDPAGMTFVAERMNDKSKEIADLGLSFVVSAGWMPGISEVVSVYAHALAKRQMDTVESVAVYFGDSGEWSVNALRDAVWYLRKLGIRSPGYFHRGKWEPLSRSAALSTANLGSPIGTRRFGVFFTPELNKVGGQLNDCDVLAYSYVSGVRTILASILVAALPLPEGVSVQLLRNVFRRNQQLPVGGFVVAKVIGQSQTRRLAVTVQMVYPAGRDYWIHGVAMAMAARMIVEGKGVQRGVHFLADA
ncbi:MAG TPA: saccharopine dehydrogenase NADP-binding domain-containing protein, partial [Alphaproteobacteria bacterium]|nr:saccharopine dehydrogenase NADP-binding domain-containing protein [Alphaproteobacteria bacterium]